MAKQYRIFCLQLVLLLAVAGAHDSKPQNRREVRNHRFHTS